MSLEVAILDRGRVQWRGSVGVCRRGSPYLEVRIHVQPSGAKVVGPGYVGDDALPK